MLVLAAPFGIAGGVREATCEMVQQGNTACAGHDASEDDGSAEEERGSSEGSESDSGWSWPWEDDGSGDDSDDSGDGGWEWPWEDGWSWPWEDDEDQEGQEGQRGQEDREDGVSPEDAPYREKVQTYAQNTDLGRRALRQLREYDIEVRYREGGGSYYDPGSDRIVIDSSLSPEEQAGTLVHEANHARYDHEDIGPDIQAASREEYVEGKIAEEVNGTVLQIRDDAH